MEYNLHPIFVHFPIAFLFLYSLLALLPFETWFPKISWKPFRLLLLVVGLVGAFVSSATGEVAADLTNVDHDILEFHEWFAGTSTFIYVVLFAGEIWGRLTEFIKTLQIPLLASLFHVIKQIITNKLFMSLFAIGGLISMMLTGMLGGIMVYGTMADPLAPLLLHILGL